MDIIFPKDIISGVMSIPKQKNQDYLKAKLKRVVIKGEEVIQLSLFTQSQVFHSNIKIDDLNDKLNALLEDTFNQLEISTPDFTYGYKIASSGKLLTNKRRTKTEMITLEHNKSKKYLLSEGMIIPPLIDLGVMLPDGRVVKDKFDKFKQINRFLEIIDDNIGNEKQLKIIDFGCGKSYLTFILYYFLTVIKNIKCEIIGLDLKEKVIDNFNKIAEKYRYDGLKFIKGNIADFTEKDGFDMIVTLHACDTATDFALYHAINMKCKYIFSVPCCQHEINNQVTNDKFNLIFKYGIMKERMSAIITDSIRASILQYCGYKTQVLEFIDFEGTPKNLLIRAVYSKKEKDEKIKKQIDELINYLDVKQTLYELVFKE